MTIYLDDDPELTALLRAADPADEDALRGAAASIAGQELCAAITTPSLEARRRRRYLRPAIVAAAVAAAIATTVGLTLIHPSTSQSAYGAALVRFAENSPRLLVSASGWHVSDVQQEDAHTGEMTFSSGPQRLDVFWVPGAREKDSDKLDLTAEGTARLDGQLAFIGYYAGARREYEAIWSVGDQAREARGAFPSKAAFLAVASTLYRVDVDTWLGAMPAWVVKPDARSTEVGTMLADIPQPAGFDISPVINKGQVTDRYQLGTQVVGAVSCAWIHQWAHGTPAERQQAIAAMATSRHWAVLLEMAKDGAYPDVVWDIADAMAGKPIPTTPGVSLEDWSKPALGC